MASIYQPPVPPTYAGAQICSNCGAALPPGAQFCAACGAPAGPAQTATCASCGAVLAPGTTFCTQCGADVRTVPPTRVGTSRPVIVLALLGALVVAAAAVAIVLLTSRDGSSTRAPVATSPAPAAPTTTTPAAPTPEVQASAVRALLRRYSTAYSDESVSGLRALFAPGFTRKNDGDPVQDRAAALKNYAKQFSQLSNPRYSLSRLSVTTGVNVATARARYRISSEAGTVTGRIRFKMTTVGDTLLITRITTTPTAVATPSTPTPPSDGGSTPTPTPTPSRPTPPNSGNDGDGGGGLPWNAPELPQPYVPPLG